MSQSHPSPVPPASLRVLDPVPPEPSSSFEVVPPAPAPLMVSYRQGSSLVVENGASIPTEFCIKSGRPSVKSIEISLRNPANPMTWFGKRPRLEVGLSRKHLDNHNVAIALTWSVLAVGALVMATGITSFSLLTALVGLLAMGISGLFRALSPVTSADASEEYSTISGVAPAYLKHLPEQS
jgi:hypothetical protein